MMTLDFFSRQCISFYVVDNFKYLLHSPVNIRALLPGRTKDEEDAEDIATPT